MTKLKYNNGKPMLNKHEKMMRKYVIETFYKQMSFNDVYVVLISHKHGEDVELYSELPNKKFLSKIKKRFDADGDDCSVEYLYSVPLSEISNMKDNSYDC